jgi:4-carboxymuconolactone decarboxylase
MNDKRFLTLHFVCMTQYGWNLSITDPDFCRIIDRFMNDITVHNRGVLSSWQRHLINVVVMTTLQTLPQLQVEIDSALREDVDPISVREAVYQCAPYIGFGKAANAIQVMNAVFRDKRLLMPLESQRTIADEARLAEGREIQRYIFGDVVDRMRASSPENQRHIQEYLSSMCFGDFYTRGGINLEFRELLTLCMLTALGGTEGQIKAHVKGNYNIGNSKEMLICAVTQCLPFVGMPRALNALNCINEVIPEPKTE